MAERVDLVDPGDKADYANDWSDWLADGRSIASRQWTVTPQTSDSPPSPTLTNDTSATVTVENFEHGKWYRLSEDVVDDQGISGKRSIMIRCQKR